MVMNQFQAMEAGKIYCNLYRNDNFHLKMEIPVGTTSLGLRSWRILPRVNGDGDENPPIRIWGWE